MPDANRNLSNSEIEEAIESMEAIITNALDEQKRPKTSRDRYLHLPEAIVKLYDHRQRLRKRLQRIHHREWNTTNNTYQMVKSELQCTCVMLRNSLQHYNNNQFQKRLQTIKPGPDAFKEINRIVGKRQTLPETINTRQGEVTSTMDKAEAFAEYFEGNFVPSPPNDPTFLEEVESTIQQLQRIDTEIVIFNDDNPASDPQPSENFTTPEEVAEMIQNERPKKSCGPDKISNYILRKFPQIMMIFLAILFNNCINNSYFPKRWKTAKIVPIPKKGDRSTISGYRPISLLCNTSKILEGLILRRLKSFCTTNNIIPDMQFGFRENHSTLHPLLRFQKDVVSTLNNHQVVVGCFLDIEKAFDSIWIKGLIHKLTILNFSDTLIKFILSFLDSRSFFVQINSSHSSTKTIRAGVAQGSKLGPYLYNIFTSDQPQPTNTTNLLYADDSLTYAKSMSPIIAARRVEEHVRRLWEYYKKWGIKVNSAKSELACFRRPVRRRCTRSAASCHNIILRLPDGTQLKPKLSVKYLGINFDERFRFNPHATAVIRKASYAFHLIHPLLRKRNGLSQKTKLLLYKQLLRPIITYCFPVWFTISKTGMNKLGLFERKILRICTGLNFDHQRQKRVGNIQLYEASGVIPLDKFMINAAKKQTSNLSTHQNPLVGNITTEERHPEPRYLDAMALLDEEVFPTTTTMRSLFYEVAASIYHRG